jgi:two-component system response regulator NreC
VVKDAAGKELLTAIEAVAAGRRFFSPAIEKLLQDENGRATSSGFADRYETLSTREREIFQLIAEARSNKEVAALLDISPATVETHRARILQKLDVHNIAEVVLYAVRRGIIS